MHSVTFGSGLKPARVGGFISRPDMGDGCTRMADQINKIKKLVQKCNRQKQAGNTLPSQTLQLVFSEVVFDLIVETASL